MPVDILLSSMSSKELTEWQAFYQIEHEDTLRAQAEARARSGAQRPRKVKR